MASPDPPTGPDLSHGVPESDLPDGGLLAGHVNGEAVLLVRRGDRIHAIGGSCSHYGGPLAEGLVVGDTIRCPWHHACFSLVTGEALAAPALNDIGAWRVDRTNGRIVVRDRVVDPVLPRSPRGRPESVVILGAGAAGHAAAEQLRREGYAGPVALIDPDPDEPFDKPNLSKDFLAGNAPEEWIPLRAKEYFDEREIERVTRSARAIDPAGRTVTLDDGSVRRYDALLFATGSSPIRLPAAVDPEGVVRYLRTLADSRAIIAALERTDRAVVIGASFIGLEVAASLRQRGLTVDVVAPEPIPLARILGDDLGRFVRELHESRGVRFQLGRSVGTVSADHVTLDNGERLPAGLVVAGIGVRPGDGLARKAGLNTDDGIVVDQYLAANAAGVFAAGDVARFPDTRSGRRVRVEHWVVAQRMGQVAARNILGAEEPFGDAPFFWSQHYDVAIAYVGHAPVWDHLEVQGRPADRDCSVRFIHEGRDLALATIFRDAESLHAEAEMERVPAHRR